MKKLALLALLCAAAAGCQNADPASRSNRASYRDIRAEIRGTSNVVNITVGDGLYASADGGGDTQSNTPTHTVDTKPEVAVGVGGGSAGTGGAAPSAGLTEKIVAALKKAGIVTDSNAPEASKAVADACSDGSCELNTTK